MNDSNSDKKKTNETDETSAKEFAIEIVDLHKSFKSNRVLKGLNLVLAKGENLVVLGKSGTGKSVLIKCVVGLIEPEEGSLTVLGENVLELKDKKLNDLRKKVGFLFQSAALYDSMTVRENLKFPLRTDPSIEEDEKEALVKEALENVGLLDAIDKMPSELSGGMRKRVGLARTLILKPAVMLYDEPTNGLDPITSREISKLITDVREKYKTSSIIITHDIACAKITADRIVVLKDGVCLTEGTFEELQNSEIPEVRAYFE
ncbi:MAG: organic solvent transporter ATP-binding protein [Bacteroidetes bacterium]|jgi:phospholipid/cholesterol/gamma-HCH transport system ATP-binding protein|nr:organic solvent transporter ATP-binding protein [Bacteroidota bacterium]MDF2450918.1 organic solvent transporter ATP-binding protein [Bacteroidota bacterium]